MKKHLDEIKLNSILKQLQSSDTNLVSKLLAQMICTLSDEELEYIKSNSNKINSEHKLEILFTMSNFEDLKKEVINNLKDEDDLEELFKEMFDIKRKTVNEDDLDFLKNLNVEETLEKFNNDEEIKYARKILKEIEEKNLDLFKITSFMMCGLDDVDLRHIDVCIKTLLKVERFKTKNEFIDNLSEKDKDKLLKGEAYAKEATFNMNKLPKHLQKEFFKLLETSIDPNTGALKISSQNTSKELLDFLEKNSKDIFK